MNPHLRTLCVAMALAVAPAAAVHAQVSFGISIAVPGVQIGINTPYYPQLVQVPGYPVYYAPQANANIFFYDGLYWVYANDDWYASSWYNGPWQLTPRDYVPLYVLRVPVRYYRQPPVYFSGWLMDAPPRWGDHWGRAWERSRPGWDRWDRRNVPRPAPLPSYQQRYSGERYPGSVEQQRDIRARNDRYQPREPVNRQIVGQPAPSPAVRPEPRRNDPRGDDRGDGRGDRRSDDRRGDNRGDDRNNGRTDGRSPVPQPRVVNTAPPAPPPVQANPAAPAPPRMQPAPRTQEQAPPPRPQRAAPPPAVQPQPVPPPQAQPQRPPDGARGEGRSEGRGEARENRGRRDDERGQDRRP